MRVCDSLFGIGAEVPGKSVAAFMNTTLRGNRRCPLHETTRGLRLNSKITGEIVIVSARKQKHMRGCHHAKRSDRETLGIVVDDLGGLRAIGHVTQYAGHGDTTYRASSKLTDRRFSWFSYANLA